MATELKNRKPNASSHSSQNMELLIDGRLYDVTDFSKKHPGGSVFRYYLDSDATEAWNEFHSRSTKAKKWLVNMKSREYDGQSHLKGGHDKGKKSALVQDFLKLRQEFEKEGLFKPSYTHVAYRVGELVLMHVLGIYLLSLGWTFTGILLLGLAEGRCGWLEHEGGHYSLTGYIPLDVNLQMFFYGFGCGMSGAWWRNQHNKHHATPQKLKHDVDLDTLPLVAFNKLVLPRNGSKGSLARWIGVQHVLFPCISTLLVALFWQFYLHPRHALRTKRYTELGWMALRYVLIGYFGGQYYGLLSTFGLYLLYNWVGANYIFLNFAVSHTHKPVLAPEECLDWVRYASDHTVNVEPSWWCNWWMSYLNFQIEHHLFPSLPQFRMPLIAPRVRALFEKHGLEYDCRSYVEAFRATFANLASVAQSV